MPEKVVAKFVSQRESSAHGRVIFIYPSYRAGFKLDYQPVDLLIKIPGLDPYTATAYKLFEWNMRISSFIRCG